MAIAPLVIAIRAAGAAAFARISAGFRGLAADVRRAAASMRIAWGRMTSAFIARGGLTGALSRLPANFRRLAASIGHATRALWGYVLASRAAQAASSAMARALPTIAMLGAKIGLVFAALVPAVGIVGNLLGAVQLIAPAIGVLALMFGTLKLATKGFGDALKAGLEGDTEALKKAFEKLTPAARSTVMTLVDLRNEWKRTQKQVQERFFTGFRDDAITVSRALQPLADKWLPRIATSFADMRRALAEGFDRFVKSGAGEAVFRNLSLAIDNILRSIPAIGRAFADVLSVASPRFEALTSDAATLADRFADWIRQMKDSGKLGEWLDEALSTMGKLKEIGGNLAGILKGIFKAGEDDGQTFLDKLVQITEKFDQFSNSAKGQQLFNLFGTITNLMIASVPVWNVFLGILAFCIGQFKVMGIVASGVWAGAKVALAFFAQFAINALLAIIIAGNKAFGWIPGLGPKLDAAEAAVRQFAQDTTRWILGIPSQKNIVVTVERKLLGPALGGILGYRGLATGGPAMAGKTYLVGEQGPELVTFGSNGYVHDASTTQRMAAGRPVGGGPAAGGGMQVQLAVTGNSNSWLYQAISYGLRTGQLRMVTTNGQVRPG